MSSVYIVSRTGLCASTPPLHSGHKGFETSSLLTSGSWARSPSIRILGLIPSEQQPYGACVRDAWSHVMQVTLARECHTGRECHTRPRAFVESVVSHVSQLASYFQFCPHLLQQESEGRTACPLTGFCLLLLGKVCQSAAVEPNPLSFPTC